LPPPHADTLDAITPNRQLSWTTHVQTLEALKENVNPLGRTLASLGELKPQASLVGKRALIQLVRTVHYLCSLLEKCRGRFGVT
jgi:hypothetical protein